MLFARQITDDIIFRAIENRFRRFFLIVCSFDMVRKWINRIYQLFVWTWTALCMCVWCVWFPLRNRCDLKRSVIESYFPFLINYSSNYCKHGGAALQNQRPTIQLICESFDRRAGTHDLKKKTNFLPLLLLLV